MAELFSGITHPLTLSLLDEKAVPALVYFMPSRGSHGAMYAELPAVRQAIEDNSFAEPNWDGYGSLGIKAETKDNAIHGIQNVLLEAPVPDITPNPNGTLSFEWETQNGAAHLEVGQTMFSFYVRPRAGEPILFSGPANQINRLHGSLIADLLFPSGGGASATTPIRYSIDV
jgi:hypothetical protein